jgi:glycine cleavage system H lipoate-binding protein
MAEKEKSLQGKRGMKVIPNGERKCIWMEAGVMSFKLCTNRFQCTSCEFDQAMSGRVKKDGDQQVAKTAMTRKREINEWMEEFRHLPADQRKCRYMLMGEVSYKICPNSFRCGECSFDQMMQDRVQPVAAHNMETYPRVTGFYLPEHLHYFRNHTWLYLERMGGVRIGLDDFARRLIGRQINRIALPAVGKSVDFEEQAWTIHHDFGELDFLSPIEGVVASVNHKLLDTPHLVSEQPYTDGWLITIDPTNIRKGLKNLLKDEEARAWTNEEGELLKQAVLADAGAAMQDGGVLSSDFSRHLPREQWVKLVKKHFYIR